MKTKELNLCEILKDCPKGTKLYSTVYGEVSFDGISPIKDEIYPISILRDGEDYSVTSDGRCIDFPDTECCLFPSKDNRDWSTFQQKKEYFDPKTLKPFDKVLVRDEDIFNWTISFFGFYENNNDGYSTNVINGSAWKQCVPYNDGTKHLLGSTDEAPEYYKYWED